MNSPGLDSMLNEAMIFVILVPAIAAACIATGLLLFGVAGVLRAPKIKEGKIVLEHVPSPMLPTPVPEPEPVLTVEASKLRDIIAHDIRGDVATDGATIRKYSRDTSIFKRVPELVVYPKDANDVSNLVKAINKARAKGIPASVTARSAGTDMSGGPLSTSVVAGFTKYMNRFHEVGEAHGKGYAITEPGVYYRDFEKETLKKGYILPSYPASRELCAMGGIVNNNSGGERTLEYGKTERYVEAVDVVLSDGSRATFSALSRAEVSAKQKLHTFEGDIYHRMSVLIEKHKDVIEKARPKVSKNSAGYALWNIIDPATGSFNLAKLICGAQGTLALTTEMRLGLVKDQPHRAMLVVFLSDLSLLPDIVKKILPLNPESFESYDDHTFKLAVEFLPQMLAQMGIEKAFRLGVSFIPEIGMVLTGGIPKLVLMAEFSEDTAEDALHVAERAREAIASFNLPTRVNRNEQESEKYWVVRRESFSLLRKNLKGLYAAPFIDDFVVPPASYTEFLPQLQALLTEYSDKFIYTVAGHIGNGNFHIIPLMDMEDPSVREVILELAPRVYELVLKYGGTTTGEHNDGIIRTPYLPMQFGPDMMKLFEETKKIFDPHNVFNPGKKIGGTFEDIKRDMITQI